jgi:hypothetical protein
MNKLLTSAVFFLFSITGFSQTQIENPGFELVWEDVSGAEDEPLEWSSLKSADALTAFAPVVAFQESSGPHSGSYCIRLKVVNTLGVSANGLLTNGRVHADTDPEQGYVYTDAGSSPWNYAFTDRPDSLVFWVKHSPVGGDKSKVEILLHDDSGDGELPHDGSTANWVGKARANITGALSAWTRISVPFVYYNTNTPDYLLAVISAGDSTMAVEDTEMWIDDLQLIYNPASISVESTEQTRIFNNGNEIVLSLEQSGDNTTFSLYGLDGKLVYRAGVVENTTFHRPDLHGIYVYQVLTGDEVITGKISL